MVLVKCREGGLTELSLLDTTLENSGVGKGSSPSKSFGKEKVALRSVLHPAPQSCSEKENEAVPGGQSSVADLPQQNLFCTVHLCKSRKQS